jgi:hypothetical protein
MTGSNMTNVPNYRTLVRGVLEQDTCLSTGGDLEDAVDMPLARAGNGQLLLRGTGLAGALLSTAARIVPSLFAPDADPALTQITGKGRIGKKRGEDPTIPSRWRVRSATTSNVGRMPSPTSSEPRLGLRSGVALRHPTGASAQQAKALYDLEFTHRQGRAGTFCSKSITRPGLPRAASTALLLKRWRCWRSSNGPTVLACSGAVLPEGSAGAP